MTSLPKNTKNRTKGPEKTVVVLPDEVQTDVIARLCRRGMVIALFLMGSNIPTKQIKQSGFRSFALGITIWTIMAISSRLILMH